MLDPLRGIGGELMDLIDGKQYFAIRAARQSGKTTLLKELARRLNARGERYALYCSLDVTQEVSDLKRGISAVVRNIGNCIQEQGLPGGFAKDADYDHFTGVLNSSLVAYCRSLDKPLVLLFDEADYLCDGILITFLRQLREGFICRNMIPFVSTIVLAGKSRLCDYKVSIRPNSEAVIITDAFNIIAGTYKLPDFSKAEVAELYAQHTLETGQQFEQSSVDFVFEQTQGQPWLVNAIACECVEVICKRDYTIQITHEIAETAINAVKLRDTTYFDSLMERNKNKWA
jgi:type II secretory pathway predicted ATPase ExeA